MFIDASLAFGHSQGRACHVKCQIIPFFGGCRLYLLENTSSLLFEGNNYENITNDN